MSRPIVAAAPARFYSEVTTAERDGGFAVLLDGKPLNTPARSPLLLPTRGLAEAIAEEWRAQGERLDWAGLPLTKLANTALDRTSRDRAAIEAQLERYAGSDLLCYRAPAPAALAERQAALWQPLLDWAADRHHIRLVATRELDPVAPSPASLAAVRSMLGGYDVFALTGLGEAVGILGSLILGIALGEGRLSGAEAFDLSQLDERFQVEQWGEDWEAAQRTDRLRAELLTAERFLRLARE